MNAFPICRFSRPLLHVLRGPYCNWLFGLAEEEKIMADLSRGGRVSTGALVRVGVLGAVASILFYFPEIPVIAFYQLDFSNLPALLGGFALGPWAGLAIVAIKDLVGLTHSSSALVGELADFLCSGAFVVASACVYRRKTTLAGALSGMAVGTALMALVGALVNYYVMIPFYVGRMGLPMEAIIAMAASVVPAVDSLPKLILLVTAPFNLLKGAVLCGVTLLIYKRLSPILHGRR